MLKYDKINTKYETIRLLGSGVFGETYEVNYAGNTYALKRQKILKEEINTKQTLSPIIRELTFFKWISKLPVTDRKFFAEPVEVFYTDNCALKHTKKQPFGQAKKRIDKLIKSKYCVEILMDLKDGTFDTISSTLLKRERYSFVVQVLYGLWLMHSNGFVHGDLHAGNIGYKHLTNNKPLILNFNGKRLIMDHCGYQISLIDYGFVNSYKYNQNKNNYNVLNYLYKSKYDTFRFLEFLVNIDDCIDWKNKKFSNDGIVNKIYNTYYQKYLDTKTAYIDRRGGSMNDYFEIIEQKKLNTKSLQKLKYYDPFISFEFILVFLYKYGSEARHILNCSNTEEYIDIEDIVMISAYRNIEELPKIIEVLIKKII